MEWIEDSKTLALTRRNIATLTAKFDDPASSCMIRSGNGAATVHAVDTARTKAAAAKAVVTVTRAQLAELAVEGSSVTVAGITVVSVPDVAHYGTRPAGAVVMPTGGNRRRTEHATSVSATYMRSLRDRGNSDSHRGFQGRVGLPSQDGHFRRDRPAYVRRMRHRPDGVVGTDDGSQLRRGSD